MSKNVQVNGHIGNALNLSGVVHQKARVTGTMTRSSKIGKELRWFDSRSEFPDIGQAEIVYIDKSTSRMYYWESNNYIDLSTINDLEISLDTTYSSAKIEEELAAKQAQINSMTAILANKPNAYSKTTAEWNLEPTLISELNSLYIYTDYKTVDGVVIPGIKIGDGLAYVIDLPFATDVGGVTEEEKAFWNNKVSAFMDPYDLENLILSTD